MKARAIFLSAFALLGVGVLGLVGYHRYFYTFEPINPANVVTGPIISPDGKYSATAFYKPYGGAAGGVTYYVQIEEMKTGGKKTIYASEHKYLFTLKWTGPDILAITNKSPEYHVDRSAELHVETEIYEESGAACRSFLLKGTYEKCYSMHGL
ncbi:DUF5412 family protein [Gorillibacterium massiliense]|uniref:DUF5412 family protein n=1 Tax=Gorillibacterium massiliense TaxID=1280390 RepID=UPI0004B36006|nr:DUF5412 family protein [Gorillibacterium massiliense]